MTLRFRRRTTNNPLGMVWIFSLAGLFSPGNTHAQGRFTVTPSLTVSAVYDDNIFFTREEPVADWYSRYTPALGLDFRATRDLTLSGSYSFDGEVYPNQPELDRFFMRQRANAGFVYRLSQRSSFNFGVLYAETHTSRDLLEDSGLDLGRRQTERGSINAGMTRRLSGKDTLGVGYRFDGLLWAQEEATQAHLLNITWSRNLTPRTSFTLAAGPRYAEGLTNANIRASIQWSSTRGGMGLAYFRGRNSIPSSTSPQVDSDSLAAQFSYRVAPSLSVSAAPGVYRNGRIDDPDETVLSYNLNLSARYSFTRWLSFVTTYIGRYQDRFIVGPTDQNDYFLHNMVVLGMTFGYPIGLE